MPATDGLHFAIVPETVLYDDRLSHLDVRVFAALARHADSEGWCWPSQERIALLIRTTARSVRNSLKRLQSAGFVTVERRGRTLSNRYRVTGTDRPITDPSDRNGSTYVTGTKRPSDRNGSTYEEEPKNESQEREPQGDARSLCDLAASRLSNPLRYRAEVKTLLDELLQTHSEPRLRETINGLSELGYAWPSTLRKAIEEGIERHYEEALQDALIAEPRAPLCNGCAKCQPDGQIFLYRHPESVMVDEMTS